MLGELELGGVNSAARPSDDEPAGRRRRVLLRIDALVAAA